MTRLLALSLVALAACGGRTVTPTSPDAADAARETAPDERPSDVSASDASAADVDTGDVADASDAALVTPQVYQPAPAGACKSLRLAVWGAQMTWTDEGNGLVETAGLPTGTSQVLAAHEIQPRDIAARASAVFWLAGTPTADGLSTTIRMAPASGGAATTIVAIPDGIGGFTVSPDGATVYFSAGTALHQAAAVAQATSIQIAQSDRPDRPRDLALDGARIAYTEPLTGRIHIVDLVAGKVAVCDDIDPMTGVYSGSMCARPESDNGTLLLQLVFSNGKVFWANAEQIRGYDVAASQFLSDLGQPIFDSATNVTGLALTGDTLFLTMSGDNGTVQKLSTAVGATPVLLAQGQTGPSSPVLDDEQVYWATSDCRILSVPR